MENLEPSELLGSWKGNFYVEVSRSFLCSYLGSVRNVEHLTTKQIINGKPHVVDFQKVLIVKDPPSTPSWMPLPAEWLVVSVDMSFSSKGGSVGAGTILRNNMGEVIFATWQLMFFCNNALEAEIQAMTIAMSLAIQ